MARTGMARTVEAGLNVRVLTAFGGAEDRMAITGVVQGRDFPVVWVCRSEEWEAAAAEGREPEAARDACLEAMRSLRAQISALQSLMRFEGDQT